MRDVGSNKVCKMRLCISGNRAKEPCFIDVELWNKQAEVANEYLKKGRPILVQGELRSSSWEKDGAKHTKMFISGNNFQFLNGGGDEEGKPAAKKQTVSAGVDEDIPF